MPNIYAIVVTFNGEEYINQCLSCLYSSLTPLNIVIIDNHSTDQTIQLIAHKFPETLILKQNQNLGFGQANNIGLKYAYQAGADFFLLINQDVYIENDMVTKLLKAVNQNNQFGILSPIHLSRDGVSLDRNFFSFISSERRFWSTLLRPNARVEEVYQCGFLNAAAWLITRDCLARVGGFDPLFYHYGEDNDYITRTDFKGLSIGFCPEARMIHDRGEFNKLSNQSHVEKTWLYALIALKNINYPVGAIVKDLFTDYISEMTSAIFYWDFAKIKVNIQVMIKILRSLGKIKKSRLVALQEFSYL